MKTCAQIRLLVVLPILFLSGCLGTVVEQAQKVAEKTAGKTGIAVDNSQTLKDLGFNYHQFIGAGKAGPGGWEELIEFAETTELKADADAVRRAQAADIVVHWNVRMRDAIIGTTQCILAYEPQVPERGGLVLMLDGTVVTSTAEEFKTVLDRQLAEAPLTIDGGPD